MVHIKIKKGLDIPIKGKPSGSVKPLIPSGEVSSSKPRLISLNLTPFDDIKFHLLAKVNDVVKIGQPIAEDKSSPGRMFVAPAAGIIREIRRGYKRRLLDIVIEIQGEEEFFDHGTLNASATTEQIIDKLQAGGIFTRIFRRPFNLLANPKQIPQSIFVKAIESAPFVPPAELQVYGHEKEFQMGLDALAKIAKVHLIHHQNSSCRAFLEAHNVELHSAEGPHPIANASVHIRAIDPIVSLKSLIWTLDAHTVVMIGHLLSTGRYFTKRIIGIAGPGLLPDQIGYFQTREGIPVNSLIAGRVEKHITPRFISGDPLIGHKVDVQDFLGFNHFAFTVVPENKQREFLHFFRAGSEKYSFSRAYLSGHFDNADRIYDFTTNQHGEHRAFVDSTLYDKVQPLDVSTMLLVKSVMAEDFELAEELGLLEVDSEDFALPTFVCPSKMEMTEIIKKGLRQYAAQVLS